MQDVIGSMGSQQEDSSKARQLYVIRNALGFMVTDGSF